MKISQNNTLRGCFGQGDDYDEEVDPAVSEYNIPERMMILRENYHQTRKRLAEYKKTRLSEGTERSDALNPIQSEADRSNG
ncbi:MAG: hypothetical protein ABJ006_00020, partial [Balneola sp.]